MSNLTTLKYRVGEVLEKHKDTRDSDMELMTMIWKEYYHVKIKSASVGFTVIQTYNPFEQLPQLDVISRIRRKYNQTGLYISDNENIRKQRRQNTERYLQFLGYR